MGNVDSDGGLGGVHRLSVPSLNHLVDNPVVELGFPPNERRHDAMDQLGSCARSLCGACVEHECESGDIEPRSFDREHADIRERMGWCRPQTALEGGTVANLIIPSKVVDTASGVQDAVRAGVVGKR